MEHLFLPCTRFHDLFGIPDIEELRDDDAEPLQELNLNVPTDELLGADKAFTYADLYAMLGNPNMLLWLTPYASVMPCFGRAWAFTMQNDETCRFFFEADGKVIDALARSPEHLSEICDVIVRLLAASVVHSVILKKGHIFMVH
jgi:hypothetical protein